LQVAEGELGGGGVAGFKDIGEQRAFFFLQAEDLFLDRAGADQLVTRDGAGLADAMRAVGGLGFDGGIPPRIEVHDGVGAGQVQAGATSLEG
jgi:hypothetical protein